MVAWKKYLNSIYYNPKHPAAYAGPKKLYEIVNSQSKHKVSLKSITEWLQDQDSYSLFKPIKYKFKRSRVVAKHIDSMWDIDLAQVTSLEYANPNVKYLLVAIDIFSRFLWVEPISNKKPSSIIDALKRIFSKGRIPKVIRHDVGGEFVNKTVDAFLKKQNIKHYHTYNEVNNIIFKN